MHRHKNFGRELNRVCPNNPFPIYSAIKKTPNTNCDHTSRYINLSKSRHFHLSCISRIFCIMWKYPTILFTSISKHDKLKQEYLLNSFPHKIYSFLFSVFTCLSVYHKTIISSREVKKAQFRRQMTYEITIDHQRHWVGIM